MIRCLIHFLLLAISLSLSACRSSAPQLVSDAPTSDHLTAAQTFVGVAANSVKLAEPLAGSQARPFLLTADSSLGSAGGELSMARAALREERDAATGAAVEMIRLQRDVEAYRQRWIGDQTFHWSRIAALALVGGWLVAKLLIPTLNPLAWLWARLRPQWAS